MRALKSPTGGEVTVADNLASELLAQGWVELDGKSAAAVDPAAAEDVEPEPKAAKKAAARTHKK